MLENLKQLAVQQLISKMASNSLSESATQEAATEGASGIMDIIKSKIAGGNLEDVTALFSGQSMEGNGVFAEAKSKLMETLQAKGMNAEEATAEAANTAPDLINSLKDKFLSTDAADSAFNLEALSGLVSGSAGDMLKNAVGDNVGGILDKAKNLLG